LNNIKLLFFVPLDIW